MTEHLRRGSPFIRSVKDMRVAQDAAPPGGYPAIRFGRAIPNTGLSGTAMFAIFGVVSAYGFYQIGQGNKLRRAYKRERFEARAALMPFLEAEEDQRYIKWKEHQDKVEGMIMANVPGWKVGESVYNTRWMPPTPERSLISV
eukprot:jgi/Mesvir1/14973/Mv14636-RA.1